MKIKLIDRYGFTKFVDSAPFFGEDICGNELTLDTPAGSVRFEFTGRTRGNVPYYRQARRQEEHSPAYATPPNRRNLESPNHNHDTGDGFTWSTMGIYPTPEVQLISSATNNTLSARDLREMIRVANIIGSEGGEAGEQEHQTTPSQLLSEMMNRYEQ